MSVEFSHRLALARVPAAGQALSLMAGAEERAALAVRFDLLALNTFTAQLRLTPGLEGIAHVTGTLAAELAPAGKQGYYQNQLQKYETDKKNIKLKAEALEAESEKSNQESEHLLHPHHKLAQAMTLIQIAISLASITVLTRKKWLFFVAAVAASGGVIMWGAALFA